MLDLRAGAVAGAVPTPGTLEVTVIKKEEEEKPVVETGVFTNESLEVGKEVVLHGVITNLTGEEVHVKLAENHRTYIFTRELFVRQQMHETFKHIQVEVQSENK